MLTFYESEVRRLRSVPFELGPDGEPNGPDLGAWDDMRARAENAEAERDELRETVKRMRAGLRQIEQRGDDCTCDCGYPGGCGCGRAMGEAAMDLICEKPNKYGSCGVCDACTGKGSGG